MTPPTPAAGTAERERFDVCGQLPGGLTVLEASAGTGKTFTIAALAARYLAEGLPVERLLVVSFTRAASGELRERVRDRLVDAERQLGRLAAGEPIDDPLVAAMARGAADGEEGGGGDADGGEEGGGGDADGGGGGGDADGAEDGAARARDRLAAALANFDAATITTTHGFCQHVLDSLGTAGDVERGAVFVEDSSDVISEVVDDLYVRRFAAPGRVEFSAAEARRIARKVVANPGADVAPAEAPRDTQADLRYRLVTRARQEVEQRKLAVGTLSYDDLLTRLSDTLSDPDRADAARRRLRDQFRVVLVDEFQDTDPVQWEILRRAFAEGGPQGGAPPAGPERPTLVLIGDPKQAIYSFRGADVHSYLQASAGAAVRATLGVNWRSDAGVLRAFDALFGRAVLGHPGIPYRQVQAAAANQQPGLAGAPVGAPLRFRVLHRDDRRMELTDKGYARKAVARALVATDVAADVVGLLSSGATLVRAAAGADPDGGGRPGDSDGGSRPGEPLKPGDVAVLVFTHREAAVVQEALEAVGVPAVISGGGSVFGTEIAAQWLRLLHALERPDSSGRARAAALTWFVGWDAARVASAGDEEIGDLQARLHHWAAVLVERGVAALLELITATEGLPARMLSHDGGERQLTDLRHVGQLLHAEAVGSQLGTTALTGWLRRRISEAAEDNTTEERSRRLESDADAVQVMTVHRSKGLEWPVVYVPYLWCKGPDEREPIPVYHDPETGRRTVDVGGRGGPMAPTHRRLYDDERRGEDLRLAYVALTRARHQAVVWWAGAYESRDSSLLRLLLADAASGQLPAAIKEPPPDGEVEGHLQEMAVAAPGCISVERCVEVPVRHWDAARGTAAALGVCHFDRLLDTEWRRTSYTGITAPLHDAPWSGADRAAAVGSEPEGSELADEVLSGEVSGGEVSGPLGREAPGGEGAGGEAAGGPAAGGEAWRAIEAPMATLPAGAAFGTLVHAVLEATDFSAGDLGAELTARLAEATARHAPVDLVAADLVAGLGAAIESPLGPLTGGRRLVDVGRGDRLDELGFELPLVGGEQPQGPLVGPEGALTVAAIAERLGRWLPDDDPLAGYPPLLADPTLAGHLRGYLTGSIDLVLRVPAPRPGGDIGEADGADGADRFVVVDYKTNRLAPAGEALTAWHYRPEALTAAMVDAHYPLQALLYSVALHRYLRWRLPGYQPERHLGGVLYLFVRGMVGADAPSAAADPSGVFSWSPPPGLIVELSELFDHGIPVA